MNVYFIFFNDAGRLRSGWRLAFFTVIFFGALFVGGIVMVSSIYAILGPWARPFLSSNMGYAMHEGLALATAVLASWLCGRLLEGLPFRAVGWSPHPGWLRDWITGSVAGAASLLLAGALITAFGGFHFSLNHSGSMAILNTIILSLVAFLLFAASEEAIFRGYPLQTMTRAHLAWVSIILTAALFAQAHLNNPHSVSGFTFVNTALAGIWLAVAYLRTRSLWFPLGLHWSWNWMMGAILGLPVSGISRITPEPLLRAVDSGPDWLTGGSYGIEGGAACTIALIVSTIWIWKTSALRASIEMLELSDRENPSGGGLKLSPAPKTASAA